MHVKITHYFLECVYLKNPLKEPQYLTEMVVTQIRYLIQLTHTLHVTLG